MCYTCACGLYYVKSSTSSFGVGENEPVSFFQSVFLLSFTFLCFQGYLYINKQDWKLCSPQIQMFFELVTRYLSTPPSVLNQLSYFFSIRDFSYSLKVKNKGFKLS